MYLNYIAQQYCTTLIKFSNKLFVIIVEKIFLKLFDGWLYDLQIFENKKCVEYKFKKAKKNLKQSGLKQNLTN